MKKFITVFVFLTLLTGCTKYGNLINKADNHKRSIMYPKTKFVVFTDPHFLSPSLMSNSKQFKKYNLKQRKMISESNLIMDKITKKIEKSECDFVIIPGDLTKDGEYLSHLKFIEFLKKIEKSGKEVYIIDGNHDINNFEAKSYDGKKIKKVENVTPEKFKKIYGEYGYNEALFQDPLSLSYIVEPVPGLWLFAVDSCKWDLHDKEKKLSITDGRIRYSSLKWIVDKLKLAEKKGKAVLLFMHHGILEHFNYYSKYVDDYLVDDYEDIGNILSSYGAGVVFTGHFHSQDITVKYYKNRYLFDIETGSLVTFPVPYRIVSIDNKKQNMIINTKYIKKIKHFKNFYKYARDFCLKSNEHLFFDKFRKYLISKEDSKKLSKVYGRALLEHYQGDEEKVVNFDVKNLGLIGSFAYFFNRKFAESLLEDLPPGDNNIIIDLKDGTIVEKKESK